MVNDYTDEEKHDLIGFILSDIRKYPVGSVEVVSYFRHLNVLTWECSFNGFKHYKNQKDRVRRLCYKVYGVLYRVKYKDLPLEINEEDPIAKAIVNWRLKIGK